MKISYYTDREGTSRSSKIEMAKRMDAYKIWHGVSEQSNNGIYTFILPPIIYYILYVTQGSKKSTQQKLLNYCFRLYCSVESISYSPHLKPSFFFLSHCPSKKYIVKLYYQCLWVHAISMNNLQSNLRVSRHLIRKSIGSGDSSRWCMEILIMRVDLCQALLNTHTVKIRLIAGLE